MQEPVRLKELCQKASTELDFEELLKLVTEINCLIQEKCAGKKTQKTIGGLSYSEEARLGFVTRGKLLLTVQGELWKRESECSVSLCRRVVKALSRVGVQDDVLLVFGREPELDQVRMLFNNSFNR